MPCNYNLRGLAEHVKAGMRAAGGTPMEFNTMPISDGVTHGDGRDEGVAWSAARSSPIRSSWSARGHMFDGIIGLVACDKTLPGRPWRCPAECTGRSSSTAARSCPALCERQATRRSARVSRRLGQTRSGTSSDEELQTIEDVACPVLARAVASSPPTRWPWRSSSWASRPSEAAIPGDRSSQGRGGARPASSSWTSSTRCASDSTS